MAIANNHWFDYEVALTTDEHGMLTGKAASLQARNGMLPGLAGLHPTVTVVGDLLLVESNPAERPPAPLWDWVTLYLPFANDAYVSRRLRAAQVRSFELELPGLELRLKAGHVVRLTHQLITPPGRPLIRTTEVVVLDAGVEVARWSSPNLTRDEW
jgi:hypothetical protein